MSLIKTIILCIACSALTSLYAAEFSIASYNCGGLSDHYDYLSAVSMQKLMQQRYLAEPENMALNDRIQQVALKIIFAADPIEKGIAQQEWDSKEYDQKIAQLIMPATEDNSPNAVWKKWRDEIITPYNIRPVVIYDAEVSQVLHDHLLDLSKQNNASLSALLDVGRAVMAERIFSNYMTFDIICLQEADYLDNAQFPGHYDVLFSETGHSINGVAWNKARFELIKNIGNIRGRAFGVKLLDKETNQTLVVVSGHLTGCNPYRVEIDPKTGSPDSARGDGELQQVLDVCEEHEADLALVGMDANVTALHPRLLILKDANYQLDAEHYLESTCSNSNLILNTRIDWIALKSRSGLKASLTNVPVLNVGLNSMQTNMSDHRPIASKVNYLIP